MPDRTIERSGLSKEEDPYQTVYDGNYYEGYLSAEDRLSGSSLSEISINGLYNFLTFPQTAAGNLYLSAGFVSFVTIYVHLMTY